MRLGATRPVEVRSRIIAATNRNLKARVREGKFREDLFYRLAVVPIRVPPLRSRVEDIPGLAAVLLLQLAEELRLVAVPELTPRALRRLARYDWPGNIRQLRNVLQHTLVLSDSGTIHAHDLQIPRTEPILKPSDLVLSRPGVDPRDLELESDKGWNLHDATREAKKRAIQRALARFSTKNQAAQALGISRYSLFHQMKALGIDGFRKRGGKDRAGVQDA